MYFIHVYDYNPPNLRKLQSVALGTANDEHPRDTTFGKYNE